VLGCLAFLSLETLAANQLEKARMKTKILEAMQKLPIHSDETVNYTTLNSSRKGFAKEGRISKKAC
jgi:hypothetical protein